MQGGSQSALVDTEQGFYVVKWRENPQHRRILINEVVCSELKLHGSALPTEPVEQNRVWYGMYKGVEKEPPVVQAHRDYAGLSALFVVFLGAAAFYVIASPPVRLVTA
jgi:hypothetical protein